MLGTASTQQLFASANSIGVLPQVWAEWNYNSFVGPAFVTSGSGTNKIPNNFTTSTTGWSATSASVGLSSDVREKDAFSSSSAISIILNGSTITATASSPASTLIANSYYKLVFYTKVGTLKYTNGTPQMISGSSVTATPSSTSGATKTYYYRIVPVGSNGQTPGIDLTNNLDVKTVTAAAAAGTKIALSWNAVANANSYKIYRSNSQGSIITLNPPVAGTTYTDTLSNGSYIENNSFNAKISFSAVAANVKDQYCKIFETENGESITTQNSILSNMERWQKVELSFATGTSTTVPINFNISAEHLNAELLMTDFQLYEISSNDFTNSLVYPAESAFLPNRPGEAFLHPLLPNSDKTIVVNNVVKSYAKPISFLTKADRNYYPNVFPSYQVVSSYDDKFKYYLTGSTGTKALQAFYQDYLAINKIVLKIDNSIAIPQNLSIKIGTGSTPSFTTVAITNSDISDNGLVVLYYNGTSWSTSSWTSPPQLTSAGKLQNVFGSVTSIQVLNTSSTYVSGKSGEVIDNVLRVIELSPRLEVDLSNYVQTVNVRKDLTSAQGAGLPFSYINANSGNIEFSNIPSIQSNSTYGQTTFENSVKSSAFNGLLRQGVKFTAILKPSSYENTLKESIPLFVMYSDTWSINDLDTTTVELFDITKLFFMGSESMWFFKKNANVKEVITGLLDYSGFSDYDYSALINLPEINGQVSGFWTDEKKTVFTNLQEFLIPQQIGAFIDEYGILRFESVSQAFNKYNSSTFNADFAITDFPISNIGSSSSNYIANIISDQFTETINQKIGAIVVNYKTPLVFQSAYINSSKNIAQKLLSPQVNVTEAKHQVWEEKNNTGVSQFFIKDNISISDTKIKIPVGTVDDDGSPLTEGSFSTAKRFFSNYSGDLIINSEIISYDGLEYTFFDPSNKQYVLTRTIRQSSDINDAISDYKLYASATISSSIQYQPTGNMMNVIRGKYGTTPQNHLYYASVNASFPMKLYGLVPKTSKFSALNSPQSVADIDYGVLRMTSGSNGYYTVALDPTANTYNFFTTSVKVRDYGQSTIIGYYLKKDKEKAVVTVAAYKRYSAAKKKLYSPKYKQDGDMEFGILFGANNNTSASNTDTYIISFKQQVDTKGTTNDYILSFNKLNSADGSLIVIKSGLKPTGISDLFDGFLHTISVGIEGTKMYVKIDSEKTHAYDLDSSITVANKSCGVFVKNNETGNTKSLFLYEFYAQSKTDISQSSVFLDKYYFTSKNFLDSIIEKTAYTKPSSFLYQQPKIARGINFYDIKMESAPVLTDSGIDIQKVSYLETDTDDGTLSSVDVSDVTYSVNKGSAFNRRFAVAHNGPPSQGLIILSAPGYNGATSTSDSTSSNLKLLGKNMILSDQKVITRVIDKNFLQNTINLTTDWVNDSIQVEKMITNIARANSGFNTDYSIKIFGNPLIQIGDFAQITYKLKRMGVADPADSTVKPIVCLVSGIQQTYKDGLESTALTLKPMIIT